MDHSVYGLFGLSRDTSPNIILSRCKDYCGAWTMSDVRQKLSNCHGESISALNSELVHDFGKSYLNAAAAILIDPSAKQCYDAWLDARSSGSPEKVKLTRSMLLWYNQTSTNITFSKKMIDQLVPIPEGPSTLVPTKTQTVQVSTSPKCRCCRSEFDFSEDYLILNCHCTTRVGHVGCMNDFSERMNGKCPVCRQQLLKRHQVSKYLFWNVKDKYKFIE